MVDPTRSGRAVMGFEHPWLLPLLLLAFLYALMVKRAAGKAAKLLQELQALPPDRRLVRARQLLCAAFVASVVIVAAGPYVEPGKTGDYLFLVDTSRSMEARSSCGDLTFLQRSKGVIRDVLAGVPEGRFGIVAFDRLAFPVTPMTYDHAWLEEVLTNGVFIGMSYRATGTRLGNALSVIADKRERLPDVFGGVQHVVLLSDGHIDQENWRNELRQSTRRLREANISVLAVGIGNDVETPIPVIDENGRCLPQFITVDGETVRIDLGSDVLKFIADESQGRYFDEGAADELIRFIREETLTDVPEDKAFTEVQRKDISWIFVLCATLAIFGFLVL